MPPTPKGIVYPTLDDGPNGPEQMQTLSESSDSALESRDIALGFTSPKSDGSGTVVRHGKAAIATAETRTNTAYGLMPTPDRVQNVRVETDGILMVIYRALWKLDNVGTVAKAAIFIGANQLKIAEHDGAPKTQAAVHYGTDLYTTLVSTPFGLISADPSSTDESVVTTGQAIASLMPDATMDINNTLRQAGTGAYGITSDGTHAVNIPAGGVCLVDGLAAGTYDVSIQYKSDAGAVSAKNRILRVRSYSF